MTVFQLYQMLRARLKLILSVLVLITGAAALFTVTMDKKYWSTVSIVIDYTEPLTGNPLVGQFSNSYMATQVDIIKSISVAKRAAKKLNLGANAVARERFIAETEGKGDIYDWLAQTLLKNTEVIPARDSRVVHVSYESLDPQFSARVANTIAQAYIETNLELSVEPARQNLEWFDKQLADLRLKFENAQGKLSTYQREQGIIATGDRLDTETMRLTALNQQLAVAQLDANSARERLHQLDALLKKGNTLDSLPEIYSNSYIQTLKSQLVLQETRLTEVQQQLGRNHPDYKLVSSDVANVKSKLKTEMQAVLDSIHNEASLKQKRYQELSNTLEAQKIQMLDVRQTRDELPALLNDVASAQRVYDSALARANESSLQSRVNQTNIAILNPAIPPIKASSPKPLLNLSLAIFFGLFLGVNLSLILEMTHRRIRGEQDVVDTIEHPLLISLPSHSRGTRKRKNVEPDGSTFSYPAVEKEIGQILVESGKIALQNVEAILQTQQEQQCRFGEAALALKLISDEDFQYALARQYHYPYLRPGEGGYAPELVAAYNPFSQTVEKLRLLRSQIMLRWIEAGNKTLAVVSPGERDGRTFISANLAIILSQLGQRTLLIDANLRLPRQHTLFNVPNKVGLTSLLAERKPNDTIATLSHFLNLSILPAGPVPPNPMELLGGAGFSTLLQNLNDKYDVILLDTPATSIAADAQTIAARAGGAIIIAARNETRCKAFEQLAMNLESTGSRVIGSVLNNPS